jgi:hypothetical protein
MWSVNGIIKVLSKDSKAYGVESSAGGLVVAFMGLPRYREKSDDLPDNPVLTGKYQGYGFFCA